MLSFYCLHQRFGGMVMEVVCWYGDGGGLLVLWYGMVCKCLIFKVLKNFTLFIIVHFDQNKYNVAHPYTPGDLSFRGS